MSTIVISKTYNIVYRTISPSGIIGLSYQKQTIDAENQGAAIEILKSEVHKDSGNTIRIDKVKLLTVQEVPKKKRQRSVLSWLAFSIFILAMSAKLITKLT